MVGRDAELARLDRFVCDVSSGSTIVLVGGPGFGKTTLWEAAVQSAVGRGVRVLSARPGAGAALLPFGGLIDLCGRVDGDELAALPGPQRWALEVALMRADARGEPVRPAAVGLGLVGVVDALVAHRPVLVAVDDLQWLDGESVDALTFVARRLDGAPLAFLFARRPGPVGALEGVLARGGLERLEVGPLSLGAVRRLLFERLGLTLSRQGLRGVVEATEGNPLFALEIGRSLLGRGGEWQAGDVPLPASLEEVLEERVAGFSAEVRRVLLAVALSEDPRADQLVGILGDDALDEAIDAGAVVLDGQRVRASHPLLAAVADRRARSRERRELHLALSGVATDELAAATHLALAAVAADGGLAARVSAAAEVASSRGARGQAVLLASHALRLTPRSGGERVERVLALASHLEAAGEHQRVTDVLSAELPAIPSGRDRARAWLLLAEGAHIERVDQYRDHLQRALEEARDDPALRALAVAKMSSAVIAVERIGEAEARALGVLPDAREAGPDVERPVLFALAWARGLSGRSVDDLCERFAAASEAAGYLAQSPERVAGQRLVWRGELEQARVALERLRALAEGRGELPSYVWAQLHLCELELRIGDWPAAAQLLDEWAQTSEGELLAVPALERCRALLAAGRGLPEEAEEWAGKAIARAEAAGTQWDWLEALRARGIAALLVRDPARAVVSLRTVWEHTEREGVDEPGVFPVAPELVEALMEIGEPQAGHAVLMRLQQLAEQQEHPWGLVTAARCAAVHRLALGYDEGAARGLADAADQYGGLGLRFDGARCLLMLGRAQRRFKQWRAARETLEQAVAAFDGLGADGWAQRARSELDRVGGRRRAAGELTASERRVVELAAEGRSNKEIAAALYVTVNTVEVHLARAYSKLGVSSRRQLAKRLAGDA